MSLIDLLGRLDPTSWNWWGNQEEGPAWYDPRGLAPDIQNAISLMAAFAVPGPDGPMEGVDPRLSFREASVLPEELALEGRLDQVPPDQASALYQQHLRSLMEPGNPGEWNMGEEPLSGGQASSFRSRVGAVRGQNPGGETVWEPSQGVTYSPTKGMYGHYEEDPSKGMLWADTRINASDDPLGPARGSAGEVVGGPVKQGQVDNPTEYAALWHQLQELLFRNQTGSQPAPDPTEYAGRDMQPPNEFRPPEPGPTTMRDMLEAELMKRQYEQPGKSMREGMQPQEWQPPERVARGVTPEAAAQFPHWAAWKAYLEAKQMSGGL